MGIHNLPGRRRGEQIFFKPSELVPETIFIASRPKHTAAVERGEMDIAVVERIVAFRAGAEIVAAFDVVNGTVERRREVVGPEPAQR